MSTTDSQTSAAWGREVFLNSPEESPVATAPENSPVPGKGTPAVEWFYYEKPPAHYRCEIRLAEEAEGGYSAYVPMLPGVVSQGESKEEAVDNIRQALEATIEVYADEIPWVHDYEPLGAEEQARWIVVNG